MKNIKYIILLLLGTGLLLSSCDDFLDVNKDPNNPEFVPAASALPPVLLYASLSTYDHALYGVFLSQALTTAGRSQTTGYPYESGWNFMNISRHPQWRRHYVDIGSNSNIIFDQVAGSEGAKNYELIVSTIRLMSTLMTTDAFGAMPREHAYKSSAPRYDEQADVYKWMFTEVDILLEHYNDTTYTKSKYNTPISGEIDRVYGGDLEKWKRLTHALKARLYLRKLPNWDPSSAVCDSIIHACDSALINWTEPVYRYTGEGSESTNPWGEGQIQVLGWTSYPNRLAFAIPTKYFMKTIMGLNDAGLSATDPRLSRIMQRREGPKGADAAAKYRYTEANYGIPSTYLVTNYPNLYYADNGDVGALTNNAGYISWMLTEELYLMKAEALYWKKEGEATRVAARENTILAVRENLKRHNITANNVVNRFLDNATYFPNASEFNIGHIMRHKYVCMYLQSEMWTDMRRYKYSNNNNRTFYDGVAVYLDLQRPYNLLESLWGNNEEWIQRINYDPQTEPIYNKPELVRIGAFENPEWLKKPMIWAE